VKGKRKIQMAPINRLNRTGIGFLEPKRVPLTHHSWDALPQTDRRIDIEVSVLLRCGPHISPHKWWVSSTEAEMARSSSSRYQRAGDHT